MTPEERQQAKRKVARLLAKKARKLRIEAAKERRRNDQIGAMIDFSNALVSSPCANK